MGYVPQNESNSSGHYLMLTLCLICVSGVKQGGCLSWFDCRLLLPGCCDLSPSRSHENEMSAVVLRNAVS